MTMNEGADVSDIEMVQRGYRITGRVQGVFFRLWTQELGQSLGLSGTVRNLQDGSVEAHVRGPLEVVETFQARLWDGPPASKVDGVDVMESRQELPAGTFVVLG